MRMEIIKWLITSSADPEKVSLFIKSLATLAVLFGLNEAVVSQIGSEIANIVVGVGMVVSSGTVLWALGRKIRFGRWSATPPGN